MSCHQTAVGLTNHQLTNPWKKWLKVGAERKEVNPGREAHGMNCVHLTDIGSGFHIYRGEGILRYGAEI